VIVVLQSLKRKSQASVFVLQGADSFIGRLERSTELFELEKQTA
jgi:hypothetical protein